MTGRRSRAAAAGLLLALVTATAGTGSALAVSGQLGQAAQQQEPLKAEIKRMAPIGDGTRAQVTVALTGLTEGVKLDAGAFSVTVGDRAARVTDVHAPGEAGRNVSALLVVDTSRSMTQNNNIGQAKTAARRFVDQLQPGGATGLLAFADRPSPAILLTDNKDQLTDGIDRLSAEGQKTALWDAVVAAAAVLKQAPGDRAVILLSDGDDNQSANKLAQAISAAKRARVTVYAIALDSGAPVPRSALRTLALQTNGRYIPAQGGELASLYTSLGQELYSRYVVEVEIPPGTPREPKVVITAKVDQARASDDGILVLPVAKPVARGLDQQPVPGLSRLETQQGLYFIAALMFAAVLLLAWALMAPLPGGGKSYRELHQRLSQYSLSSVLTDDHASAGGLGANHVLGKAAQVAEAFIRRSHLEEALLTRLELAGLKLRVGEMALIWLASALGVPLLLLAISRSLLLAFVGVLLGTLVPLALLVIRASRRQAKFDEQLPDTLQLLSGALQAGHSLLQSVDTAAKEAGEPISVEFQRVLTEARLGMPLEEALEGMAKRMNSQDFEWTVMAIALQRQVGGNLAELLNAVAQTIRERYSLKRQIRALSAEGRLSSIILSVLPFIMFFALLAFNPTFLAPLYSTPIGLAMLSGAAILMIVGVVWMKKITEIEV
jgi:tight adherence protein B